MTSARFSYGECMPRTGSTAVEIREKAIDAAVASMREDGFDKVRLTDSAHESSD